MGAFAFQITVQENKMILYPVIRSEWWVGNLRGEQRRNSKWTKTTLVFKRSPQICVSFSDEATLMSPWNALCVQKCTSTPRGPAALQTTFRNPLTLRHTNIQLKENKLSSGYFFLRHIQRQRKSVDAEPLQRLCLWFHAACYHVDSMMSLATGFLLWVRPVTARGTVISSWQQSGSF